MLTCYMEPSWFPFSDVSPLNEINIFFLNNNITRLAIAIFKFPKTREPLLSIPFLESYDAPTRGCVGPRDIRSWQQDSKCSEVTEFLDENGNQLGSI